MKKPISAKNHGIIDYIFSAIQIITPPILGINSKASKTFETLGTGFLVLNSLTDTPVGVKKIIPFKNHQKADACFLVATSLLTFSQMVKNDKKALAFHVGFLTFALTNYLLTDYNSQK